MYKTYDFKCRECDQVETVMLERDVQPKPFPCDCGGEMYRTFVCQIARVSYPDGTTDRFKFAKEKRQLDKLKREAKKAGRSDDLAAISAEINNVKQASKSERQAANICKVSEKE